jgi:hypothetical protein
MALNPSAIIVAASNVVVVVPSPAKSAVLIAACFNNCAPMFSIGFSNSIERATVTPSLVDTGLSPALSIITLRPFGPKVHVTASDNLMTPFNNLVLLRLD